MDDFTPMSHAEAAALGFFRIPQRKNLFGHPRLPGFLFRIIASVDEAIACGGLTVVCPSHTVSYFGLDLLAASRAGKIGEFGKPKSFETRAAAGLLPSYEERSEGSSQTRRYGSVVYVELETEWTNLGPSGKYIGIITKADRGLVVDLGMRSGDNALHPSAQAAVSIANNILTEYGSAGDVKWKFGNSLSSLPLSLPMVSGYIQRAIPVPKRAFLTRAKPGFIGEIEANDSIKRAYGAALDELIASASGNTHDEFRLYPVTDAANRVVKWSVRRRDVMLATQQNGILNQPFTEIYKDTDIPVNGNTTAIMPSDTTRSRTGVLTLLTSEKSRGGIPCPFWVAHSVWSVSGTVVYEEGFELSTNDNGFYVFKDDEAFSLDEVPFAKVMMAPNSELSAGTVLGPVSPRVRPSAAPTGALDASTRVEDEVRFRSANMRVNLPSTEGTATAQELAAASAEAELDTRAAEVEWMTPFLSEFAAYVVTTVKDLDQRARAKLKG